MEENKNLKVPIARTKLTQKEFDIITKPLKSGWVVQGPYVKNFENSFSKFTEAEYSVAVTSCTTALQLSLSALGFGVGDEAIIPAFTWISTANVIEHLGGKVVFCDINLNTFNINVDEIEELITPRTKVIIPVHLFGLSSEMDKINKIAKKHRLHVVEDAACGFGAKYKNQHVGTFGDMGCFSFHPRKAITTGEGGMIITSNNDSVKLLRSMRDHGAKVSDFERHSGTKPYSLPEFPYAGYNFRMTDIQASIGSSQMDRADEILSERYELAQRYSDLLGKLDFFQLPYEGPDYKHGFQSYACLFDLNSISVESISKVNTKRNMFMERLDSLGIATRPATHAVHMLEYYREKYKISPEDYPNSFIANEASISFPLFNGMTQDEFSYVITGIQDSL